MPSTLKICKEDPLNFILLALRALMGAQGGVVKKVHDSIDIKSNKVKDLE